MPNWTSGYITDIGYIYAYFTELNPHRMRLALVNAGLHVPEVTTACELGFGQGLSANIHAAASTAQWYGTDFNPSQAGFAQSLSDTSGSGAQFYDNSFAEFADRTDLPDFDFIGINATWSWISDENRRIIVDFIRNKLKVGGVVYISYNTQPGWAGMVPLRELLTEHAEKMGASGNGIVTRIDQAIGFAEKLMDTNPAYARVYPQVLKRLKKIKGQSRNYLAHEYFNRDWSPMSFSEMSGWLESAKLDFACSADYLDMVDRVNLTADQQTFLNAIPDPRFRQTVRDFMVNQQYRRDYWVKGARRMSPLEQAEELRTQRVALVQPRSEVSLEVTGSAGKKAMVGAVYGLVLDVLADHKPKTLGHVEQLVKAHNISFARMLQSVLLLMGSGALTTAQDSSVASKTVEKITGRLNAHLCAKARSRSGITHLASPVTGGGIAVGRFQQLFLQAMKQDKHKPAEWAEYAWKILQPEGQHLTKKVNVLQSEEENLAELISQAELFSKKTLPVLRALEIA